MPGDIIDGIANREFTVPELSAILMDVPNMYNLITSLGIFGNPVPLETTTVAVETWGGTLNLLPTTERGGPATKGAIGKRGKKIFEIPQIAHEDAIMAADIQNLARFGARAPLMFEDKVAEKLQTMAAKHYLTHEFFRAKALQGKVVDADGTELINFFTEFGITEQVEFFGAAGGIRKHVINVKRHIEDNLRGESMTGVACLCSREFMDMLMDDADVKAAYNSAAAMMQLNPALYDVRFSFSYQGVIFVEYNGQGSYVNPVTGVASTVKFIPANEARFFPLGTMDCAHFVCAPADFIDTANMPAQLFYARTHMLKLNRGIEIYTQSNPLPIWKKPALLVKGSTAAS